MLSARQKVYIYMNKNNYKTLGGFTVGLSTC